MALFEGATQGITRTLTRVARPTVRIGPRTWSTFVLVVAVGLVSAVALGIVLSLSRGLSVGLVAGLGAVSVATEAGLARLRRGFTGQDHMVFYESFLAIAFVAQLLLWVLGAPVLPHLEVLLLALGSLQAVGRIGCFMIGCCHGSPHAWGVCYGRQHEAVGFNAYLVGVPLVPVQLVEMLWALGSVALGSVLVMNDAAAGAGLAAYVVAYGVGRFIFEFARGDAARPYAAGFSEAQWIAISVTTAVVWAGWVGVLPPSPWHVAAGAGLLGSASVVALRRRVMATPQLLHPGHVGEVARALRVLHAGKAIPRDSEASPHVIRTSLGLELSGGCGDESVSPLHHYTFTLPPGTRDSGLARALTRVIRSLLVPLTADPPSIEFTSEVGGRVRLSLVPGRLDP